MAGINLILAPLMSKCLLSFGLCTCYNANQFLMYSLEKSYTSGPIYFNSQFPQIFKCLAVA